ncbi:TRAP transporter small permease [Diaphorobacter sp. HDW4B]|uniref:TRAP transporter small permease n=1 Tax=Diaphorobacter sp. HDW4B TaxID=2714925 RepID=UPI001407463A|nr:TRAP transporter small permease [Diaphorobacter sp. HDW4B]QIL70199.1 TRAP transporter small permease [Diaphorobacter sp. HDW4B]
MSLQSPAESDQPSAPDPTPPPSSSAPDEPRSLCIEDWLTVIVMAALALITFANVIVRYFTSSSFAWTEEISVFLMIVLALVAGSAAVARDRHIRIEFFSESGSANRRRKLAQLGAIMVALLFTLIAVLSIRTLYDDYRFEETSPGIGVPVWWYTMWLPILSIAIALRAIGLFIRRSRQSDIEYLTDNTESDAPAAGGKQP